MKGFISKVKDKSSQISSKVMHKNEMSLSVDSATESPEMKEATRRVEETQRLLTATRDKYSRYQRSQLAANADHRAAAASLLDISANLRQGQEFAVLAECVDKVARFSSELQAVTEQLNQAMVAQLLAPLAGVLEGDLAEAEFSKKRFNKVLSDFDALARRIAQLNAKGQPNPQKLQEAQREQEQLQAKFDTVGQQTMQTLTDVNHRVEFALFQTLVQYVETYQNYFERGSGLLEDTSNDLAKYRAYSEKKREVLEQGGSVAHVRLEDFAGSEGRPVYRDALERSVMELVERERTYVRKLDAVSKTYIQNIRVDEQLAAKFSEEDRRAIFCNVEELLLVHKALVMELEADLPRYPHYGTGRILQAYSQRFRAYLPYLRNYSQAINALDQVELRSQSVRKFLRTMDRKNNLRNLLAEPTGRVPTYVVVLQQLLEHTPASAAAERATLTEVMADLGRLGVELQAAQRVSGNIGTMLGVYNELSGYAGTLLEPSRVLRREGTLEVHFATPDGKQRTELHKFYLCTDVLIQAKKKSVLAQVRDDEARDRKFVWVKTIPLDGASVDALPDNEEMNVLNAFELRAAATAGSGLVVCCASPEERTEWVDALTAVIAGSVTNAVFEVPLETVLANQRDRSLNLPEVVVLCTEYLLHHSGLAVEGIFRMSGSKREIAGIISKFNRGEAVVLESETSDEHSVAGVLKHWVRHLPEPLMTFTLTEDFLACDPADLDRLRECLSSLPNLNLRVASLLFYLLHAVTLQADVNKMDAKNLAIVFAPGLLRRDGASDFDTSHYEQAYACIGSIIDNYQTLFNGLTPTDGSLYKRTTTTQPRRSSLTSPQRPMMLTGSRGGGGVSPAGPPVPPKAGLSKASSGGLKRAKVPALPAAASDDANNVATTPPRPSAGGPRVSSPKGGGGGSAGAGAGAAAGVSGSPLSRSSNAASVDSAPSPSQLDSGVESPGVAAPPAPARPLCARCGEPIRSGGLKALNAAWHRDCFVCTACQQPFNGGKVLAKDNKPHCESCYRSLFGGAPVKMCKACDEKITGPFLRAIDAYWHAGHFVCRGCSGSVSEGYYESEGWPFCVNCYQE